MNSVTAARRSITALKEKVKKSAPVANLYLPQFGGARSPEVVRAYSERQRDLSAIEFYLELIESAKLQKPPGQKSG